MKMPTFSWGLLQEQDCNLFTLNLNYQPQSRPLQSLCWNPKAEHTIIQILTFPKFTPYYVKSLLKT